MDTKWIVIFAAFIVIAIYVSIDSKRNAKKKIDERLTKSWGKAGTKKLSKDEFEIITHYYEDCCDGTIQCDETDVIDDITWNDLDMNAVFSKMDITNSSIGREYLYKMLRMPFNSKEKLNEFDRVADYFDKHEKERKSFQKEYVNMGFVKGISISDYISLVMELKSGSNLLHYILLVVLVISFVVGFTVNALVGTAAVILTISIMVISYYQCKAKVEPYFVCIKQVVKMVSTADNLAKFNIPELERYNDDFRQIAKEFASVVSNSSLLTSANVTGSLTEMLMDYIRMLSHLDLITFNNIVKKLNNKDKQIFQLMDRLGFLEAAICVASFRRQLPYWSKPKFEGIAYEATQLYHPLINEPVANSIQASRHVLLTGSNASGKSTFLKTVAINALLSQAINTSLSKGYRAPMYRIYSSMSLRDDLGNNDSYYIVEIKALKRILDAIDTKDTKPVLCFVDEVLRGTNTVERIAASSEILQSLNGKNVLCFAATHDIELTSILKHCYDNYHFQEEVTENDVQFNFRLHSGPAVTRNAIKLLNIIGYDKKIIAKAEDRAREFLEKGVWK